MVGLISPRSSLFKNAGSQRELAHAISQSRREFLWTATGAVLGSSLFSSPLKAIGVPRGQKAVVVTFGGGARDDETFAEDGQENIPHLLNELIPRGTFFTQVVNKGILGHYVATASLTTGAYETFNNFAAVPPDFPTVFRVLPQRPAPSRHRHLGSRAQQRFRPPRRKRSPRIRERNGRRRYSAEAPARTRRSPAPAPITSTCSATTTSLRSTRPPPLAGTKSRCTSLAEVLKMSVSDFAAHAKSLASPDELSVYVTRQLMRQLAPSLLWITLHDIDIAHSGTFSLYIDGIRRSDRLCAETLARH